MSRQQFFVLLLLFMPFLHVRAQHTTAARDPGNKIPAQVKVVGIGNVSPFAKESTDLNMDIAAFLISQRKFSQVVLLYEDWRLRPLHDYLCSKQAFDSITVDSLVSISLADNTSRTASFSSFAGWLKKYNLTHPQAMVHLSGVVPDDLIPPAYFLTTYIFPADRSNGERFARNWRTDIPDDTLAFKDIAAWYRQINRNPVLAGKYKALLLRCGEDIDHNNIVREGNNEMMTRQMTADLKTRWMARLLLKKADKPTLILANNEDMAKAPYVFQGDTFPSLGFRLQELLKDRYYSCLTDFAAASSLQQINPETGQPAPATIPGSAQVREWSRKKTVLFLPEDSSDLRQYRPRTIFPLLGMEREIMPVNNIPAANALFIVNSVTPVSFLKRITDIGDWVKTGQ